MIGVVHGLTGDFEMVWWADKAGEQWRPGEDPVKRNDRSLFDG